MTPDETATVAALTAALAAGDHDTVAAITARLDADDETRRARLTAPGALLSAALYYAKAGLPVFPLRDGGKTPATAHGFKDASTDPDQVRAWWTASPQANIGLPTGHRFTVIDVDVPAGYYSLAYMRDADLIPPILGRVITPSGGTHLHIAATGEGNSAGKAPGIDIRGLGGYVVAPPSRSEEGMWLWSTPLGLSASDGHP